MCFIGYPKMQYKNLTLVVVYDKLLRCQVYLHDRGEAMDKTLRDSLLMDFYGELLPKRQKDVIKLYYEEDFSLSEIAEEFGITRQGVHDALKKGQQSLAEYEKCLGLIQRFQDQRKKVCDLQKALENIIVNKQGHENLEDNLKKIKELIEDFE